MANFRRLPNKLAQNAHIAKVATEFSNRIVQTIRTLGHGDLRLAIANRQRAAKALMVSVNKAKNVPAIHRIVNARAEGVTFRRIGGKIVPMRGKK